MSGPLPPRIGMKEIAAEAGVSIATVSMSLSNHPQIGEHTRQHIRQLSQQMGYRPPRRSKDARAVQKGVKSDLPTRLGFLLLGSRIGSETNQGTLHTLTIIAARRRIRMEVFCVEEVEKITPDRARIIEYAAGVDGVILTGYVDAPLLQELNDRQIPHVLLGTVWGDDQVLPGRYGQIVTPDSIGMARHATSILLAEGHRRIAYACNRLPRGLWNERWLRGYRQGLMDAGILPDDALIHVTESSLPFGQSAADAFYSLSNPPTAFVFPAIELVPEFMAAMRRGGHTISAAAIITGGSDRFFHFHSPAELRSIVCDPDQIAELLIHQLCQLCRQPLPCPAQLVLPFHLTSPAAA